MGILKSKTEKKLDLMIEHIQINMANNYKDAAQEDLKELEETIRVYAGDLKERTKCYYESQLAAYKEKLKGYSHKDQKPYWS